MKSTEKCVHGNMHICYDCFKEYEKTHAEQDEETVDIHSPEFLREI